MKPWLDNIPTPRSFSQVILQDAAFWVILPLAMVIAPHLPYFPLWMPALILVVFAWRLLAIYKPGSLPGKWLLLPITLLATLATALHYGTLFGKTAGTAILAVLLSIKLLESQQRRDYMLLISVSFFIIITNFLNSQSIPTVLYMLTTVVVLVMSLVFINQGTAKLKLRRCLGMSFQLVGLALPMMLVLFVLFPRIPGPLWLLPEDAHSGRTGLSETMTPGNISRLIQSNEVAFRVEFDDPMPQQVQLYWRALVLWHFDGRSWEPGKMNKNAVPSLIPLSLATNYTVTLEPHDKNWLFALDMPAAAPGKSRYTNNFLLRSNHNIKSLHRYQLRSYLQYRIEENLSIWEQSAGLKLPASSNPKTIELAQQWKQQHLTAEAIIQQALLHFNQNEFVYTLQPPLTPGFNPVDQFLFDTRRGFCEHYASSFTLLMRAAGIPARVVTGYQGGTINPINQMLTVRQSDAHAWSEVWLADRGWIRVDPTAAIAPERIENSLDAALGANEARPLHIRLNVGVLKHMRFYWDALDNRWKQWVIGYDPKRQKQLLSSWLNKAVDYDDLVLLLVSVFSIITLLISLLIFKPFGQTSQDPVQRLYNKFCRKLAHRGLSRHPYEGPLDFARRAADFFPQQKDKIKLITRVYISLRYRSSHSEQQFNSLRQMIKNLKLST